MIQIPKLSYTYDFPHPSSATEDGIVAYGGDLSPSRLMRAYREGIFPWYLQNDPILWWSPNPRLILSLEDFKLRKSLQKRRKHFEVKIDTNFEAVVNACAKTPRSGQKESWILPDIHEAYTTLHHLGHAHSVEAYQDGVLVGGLYGVSVGAVFCGESMFSHVNDASKVAFALLVEKLKEWGYEMIDAQVPTEHLKSLGAIEVHRDFFLTKLELYRDKDISNEAWII